MTGHAARLLSLALLLAAMTGAGAAPSWAQDAAQTNDSGTMARADADMRDVLVALDALEPRPLDQLSAVQARRQPTPADAVAAMLRSKGQDPEALKRQLGVTTKDVSYPGAAGDMLPARIYTPEGAATGLPVILYIHGGGWVIGDLDSYDATPRALAAKTKALVVSVHYRLAPEHRFPAAHDDTAAAYAWMLKQAAGWGGDPERAAIVGESAGGNMAITTAMAARDKSLTAPRHVVAVYPVAGTNFDSPSYIANANAKPLNLAAMRWFFDHTVRGREDLSDPRLDLVRAADLKGLPPVTVITADIDPLKAEGATLAARIDEAGGAVALKNYDGVTHEFFGMGAAVKRAAQAQDYVVERLRQDLVATASN